MIREPALILIDEFGNTHIDLSKDGTFSHFIYVALIIPLKHKTEALSIRKQISKSSFFGKELKSSKLGPKMFDRRLAALKELVGGLDFTVDILVIDKSKLDEADGLKYKQVFYKYFQNLFVAKYSQRYESFEIIADKVGEAFKYELQQYVREHGIQADLFNPNRTFHLKDDYTEEPLLQLADLVCGSVGKIFCSSHAEARAKELFQAVHTRASVDYFPSQQKVFLPAEKNQQVDEQVGSVTINLVLDFMENNPLRTQQEYLRMIDYLLLHYNIDRERVVPTYELLHYLEQFAPGTTEEKVRYMVRTLRYEGLFIVSHAGKSGYKLAANYHDIEQYFNHFLKYVIPMLQKVKILNESISASTYNKINPLEKDETFQQLKELLSAL
ncbi:DUF3800 domain-containing protein [Mucilaginibacter sp. OK098]|uniref:DUF3800 domain-containing protein n=1 Tax=Mucilaginibacter sp. OK098 TaxID=1855297 RepID=UPI0009197B6E|nr:DUF3800 domain-containing protein [Mucilaginibacter sp. OK098]SHN23273.1 Protein of unknown function [Mucilaginibacter sp. OK098]